MKAARRLIEVDLARFAPKLEAEQRQQMRGALGGQPPFTLQYMRAQLLDIMNTQMPMFGLEVRQSTDFSVIETALRRSKARSGKELEQNIVTSRLVHQHFKDSSVTSKWHDFGSLSLGLDQGMRYWAQAYYGRDGKPVITFIDPRGGSTGLTRDAREVVHAAMHVGIRERNPDFESAILEIVQLPYNRAGGKGKERTRRVEVHTLVGDVKYCAADLDRMFTTTLRLWKEVNAEAAEETRKRAGGAGDLI